MLNGLATWFDDYVAEFADSDGNLHAMQRLKLEHSRRVQHLARRIADELHWTKDAADLAEVCGMLHDVGRFSQFAEFGTFHDAVSVDHGENGARILADRASALLPEASRSGTLSDAVRLHNKPALPNHLCVESETYVKLVRDADKLDIFEVVYDGATHPDSLYTEMSNWLNLDGGITPEVLVCATEKRPVPYGVIRSLADLILVQLHWVYDLNYTPSFRIMRERGTFERLRSLLPARAPEAAPLLDEAQAYLRARGTT